MSNNADIPRGRLSTKSSQTFTPLGDIRNPKSVNLSSRQQSLARRRADLEKRKSAVTSGKGSDTNLWSDAIALAEDEAKLAAEEVKPRTGSPSAPRLRASSRSSSSGSTVVPRRGSQTFQSPQGSRNASPARAPSSTAGRPTADEVRRKMDASAANLLRYVQRTQQGKSA